MSDNALRVLGPQVLGALVRRGNEFAAAEDAVQEAMLEAHRNWTGAPPDDPKGWLSTVATHKLIDAHRSDAARRRREDAVYREREAGPTEQADDDTLLLLFLCCHPVLSPASAVALTLRAVGWLTTKEIADAFLVPEATMAQRIRRAKRTVAGQRLPSLRTSWTRFAPICTKRPATSIRQLSIMPGRRPQLAAPPNGTLSPSRPRDCAVSADSGDRCPDG